jgi:hypothetical protein
MTAPLIKELNGKFEKHYGYDEVGKYYYRLVTPRNTDISSVYEHLRSRWYSHCSHNHDCCGCRTYSYSLTKASAREWKVRVTIGRNY